MPTVTAAPAPGSAEQALYDLEAEGGLGEPETVTLDASSAVDLVGAMRQRRHGRRRQPPPIELPDGPARRPAGESGGQEHLELEPLMFDPSLLGDPPAPHPFPFPERLREPQGEAGEATEPVEPVDRVVEGPPVEGPDPSAAPRPPRNFAPPRLEQGAHPRTASRSGPAPAANDTGGHRRVRRASVPSWDEIMFGGKRD